MPVLNVNLSSKDRTSDFLAIVDRLKKQQVKISFAVGTAPDASGRISCQWCSESPARYSYRGSGNTVTVYCVLQGVVSAGQEASARAGALSHVHSCCDGYSPAALTSDQNYRTQTAYILTMVVQVAQVTLSMHSFLPKPKR